MAKQKFNIVQSTCIPVAIDNCNTDLIIPARYLASTTRDPKFFGDAFMHDLRYDADGQPVADFVMNQPEFSEAPREGVHEIIVGGQNWGSGSSREHAPIAIKESGISLVIAESFARIFYRNSINIGLAILECPEAAKAISEGDEVEADLESGIIYDKTTGEKFETKPFPAFIEKIINCGGLVEAIKQGEIK